MNVVEGLEFNSKTSSVMYIDLNSCFAGIEQQANPHLRGKPIAVAAYITPRGCILAPSVEAKLAGVRTGMRVMDGKALCPGLIILATDPWKYRDVHLKLKHLLSEYTSDITPKSIDEFVLDFSTPPLKARPLKVTANEIKRRIKCEIGEWLTVSVGIAPNRFLAKLASGLHKPDGLNEINKDNFYGIYSGLELADLPYIKLRNSIRLGGMRIYTVSDFYKAPLWKLKAAFESVNGYYWYLRLRGFEIDGVEFGRRSYGNSYALPIPLSTISELSPILSKLTGKTGFRLRRAGFTARGVHVAVSYRDGKFWHKAVTFERNLSDSKEIYKKALKILALSPYKKPVRNLAVAVFDLWKRSALQLELFEDNFRRERAVEAVDKVNERWGNFVITPARMLYLAKNAVPDRIAFGGIKELEEFTLYDMDKYNTNQLIEN